MISKNTRSVPIRKPIKTIVTEPARLFTYAWYELLAVLLFFTGFIYVASLQFFTIEENVGYVSCRSTRRTITMAVSEYRADFPSSIIGHVKKEINLKRLLESKYLRNNPKCWADGVFKLNSRDEVYCTYHCPELEDVIN